MTSISPAISCPWRRRQRSAYLGGVRRAATTLSASLMAWMPGIELVDQYDVCSELPRTSCVTGIAGSDAGAEPRLIVIVSDYKQPGQFTLHLLDPWTWTTLVSKEHPLDCAKFSELIPSCIGDLDGDGTSDFVVTSIEYSADSSGACIAVSGADLGELFRVSGKQHSVIIKQAAPNPIGHDPALWILYTAIDATGRGHGAMQISKSGQISSSIKIPGLKHEPTLVTPIRGVDGSSTLVIAEPTVVPLIDEDWGVVERVDLALIGCTDGLAYVLGEASVKSEAIGSDATSSEGQMIACGDPNGDGIQDIAVSMPEEGTVRLLSGSDLSLLRTIESPSDVFSDCGGFGRALALVPDCDADGIDDLVVGNEDWSDSSRDIRWHFGAVHVYSLASGALIGCVLGTDTVGLGSGFAAFREDDGVSLIAVESRKLHRYRITVN